MEGLEDFHWPLTVGGVERKKMSADVHGEGGGARPH